MRGVCWHEKNQSATACTIFQAVAVHRAETPIKAVHRTQTPIKAVHRTETPIKAVHRTQTPIKAVQGHQ